MAEEQPSGLFAIFLLTIYSLVLIPYTLYRVCSSGEEKAEAVVKVRRAPLLHQGSADGRAGRDMLSGGALRRGGVQRLAGSD